MAYLALLIGAAVVGSAFVRVTLQDNALAREMLATRAQIAMLETQQSYLQAEVAQRGTVSYIEQQARELGYVKPGEGLASVRDAAPTQTHPATPDANETVIARISRWLALFLHP